MRPSDFHTIIDLGSGPPSPLAYFEADTFGRGAQGHGYAVARIRFSNVVRQGRVTGSLLNRNLSKNGVALPGYWIVLREHAEVTHSAGLGSPRL
jgi:hypothetical protein